MHLRSLSPAPDGPAEGFSLGDAPGGGETDLFHFGVRLGSAVTGGPADRACPDFKLRRTCLIPRGSGVYGVSGFHVRAPPPSLAAVSSGGEVRVFAGLSLTSPPPRNLLRRCVEGGWGRGDERGGWRGGERREGRGERQRSSARARGGGASRQVWQGKVVLLCCVAGGVGVGRPMARCGSAGGRRGPRGRSDVGGSGAGSASGSGPTCARLSL